MFGINDLPDLITPLPIYGLLLLAVIAWRKKSLVWLGILAWAYLMSIPVLADRAADLLERRYPPIADLEPYRNDPVLLLTSGGQRLDSEGGWVNLLANSGWERLLVAVTTARQVEGTLFIAGGPPKTAGGEAISVTVQGVIDRMGIDLDQVVTETTSTNTYENLANLKDQLDGGPFIMVTSAAHLPRAMAVADKLELDAMAQPADYLSGRIVGIRRFWPSLTAILQWQTILHEVVGLLYYKVRGYS